METNTQLWDGFAAKIRSVTESSLASGKLCSLATTCTTVLQPVDGAVCATPFIIRTLQPRVKSVAKPEGNIQTLPESTLEDAKRRSPFLNPDPDLVVAALPHHNVILNKYPVTKHHILLCTREFRTQEEHLTPADLEALEMCAKHAYPRDVGALCFYNCGLVSGASQGHKHVQIVPAVVEEQDLPPQRYFLDALAEPLGAEARTIPGLKFRHAFRKIGEGDSWVRVYGEMLEQLGMKADGRTEQSYNLVCKHDWMFVVPRARECAGIERQEGEVAEMSVNSLGFAGSFLVKNPLDVEAIKKKTPLAMLDEITFKI